MLQNQIEAGQQVLVSYMFNKGLCALTVIWLSGLAQERKGEGEIPEKMLCVTTV